MSGPSPCASCAELIVGNPRACPHCGETRRRGIPAAAMVLGLSLSSGCWGGQALYGAPYTPTDSADTADTADTSESSAKEE